MVLAVLMVLSGFRKFLRLVAIFFKVCLLMLRSNITNGKHAIITTTVSVALLELELLGGGIVQFPSEEQMMKSAIFSAICLPSSS